MTHRRANLLFSSLPCQVGTFDCFDISILFLRVAKIAGTDMLLALRWRKTFH